MYHSIEAVPKNTVMRSLHVTPRSFRFQMRILKILGYKALSLKKLRPYLEGVKKGKVVGLTFDDGYQNNIINAAPILKKYNFSATCYIVSERIGSYNTWDINKGIPKKYLMNHKEIKEWLSLGMDIGAHTQSHKDLTALSKEEAYKELNECKRQLEAHFNIPIADFCYPFGHFNESVKNLVEDAGYLSATSMLRGRLNSYTDIYALPRVPINYRTFPHLFLAKILTRYEDNRR